MENDSQGRPHGRGHRQARWRLPRHRRPAEGLRRGPRHRHPARRVRHRRHRDRPGAARLPPGGGDPVRRVHLPGVRPDRQPGRQDARPLPRQGQACPMVIRIPVGGGIGAVEHHSRVPEAYFAHTAGLRVVALLQPRGRLLDDPAGHRDRRPGALLRAEAPLLRQGRGRRDRRRRPRAATRPRVCRRAPTSTLVAYGPMVKTCLRGRRGRRGRGRRALEVIDLRSLSPLDFDTSSRLGGARPAGWSSSTRHRRSSASAPRSPPRSPSAASTPSRRRCCGSAATTCPTRRASSRRSSSPTSTGCSTPSTARSLLKGTDRGASMARRLKQFKLPDLGEGLTEAEIVTWKVKVGRHRQGQRHRRRDRDRQVAGRAAGPVRRHGHRAARAPRARPSRSARRSSRSTPGRISHHRAGGAFRRRGRAGIEGSPAPKMAAAAAAADEEIEDGKIGGAAPGRPGRRPRRLRRRG